MTAAEKLAELETAIKNIQDGVQSASTSSGDGSRNWSYADLGTMYKERQRLEVLAAREARGGGVATIRVRGVVPHG